MRLVQHLVLEVRLLCGHLLLHYEIIEIAARVDCIFCVKSTRMHIFVHLLDKVLTHLEELSP